MVWGAFSASGTLDLSFTSKKMNSEEYQQVLTLRLLPYLHQFQQLNLIYQQDNARIHTSRSTLDWFQHHQITLMSWPTCSPDLNPMENLWGVLVCQIYANNHQFQTEKDLKVAILEAWNRLSPDILMNLVNSMPNRIFKVINRNGNYTDY